MISLSLSLSLSLLKKGTTPNHQQNNDIFSSYEENPDPTGKWNQLLAADIFLKSKKGTRSTSNLVFLNTF